MTANYPDTNRGVRAASRIAAGVTRVRSGTFGPTTGGCSTPSTHLPSQTNSYAEQVWRREVGPDTQGQDHAGRRQFGFTFDPFTAPSSPAITGSAKNHLFFIIINRTHMHRHIILLQCVDLNNMHRPSFIIDASLPQNGSHASCYARLCQGLHSTAIKSDHLFGRSAPRTYSTICISSESCLGSLVGFARLPCFGTLRSVPSAKVALGELM